MGKYIKGRKRNGAVDLALETKEPVNTRAPFPVYPKSQSALKTVLRFVENCALFFANLSDQTNDLLTDFTIPLSRDPWPNSLIFLSPSQANGSGSALLKMEIGMGFERIGLK